VGGSTPDVFIGTDGDDTASGGAGQDSLSGGAGNDSFTSSTDPDVLDGGAGDDFFRMYHCAVVVTGEGRDVIKFGPDIISWLGTGQTYDLAAQTIVTDFDTGPGGDTIDLTGLFTYQSRVYFGVYDRRAVDPFETGQSRLVDTSDGAQIQLLDSGTWKSLVLLRGVTANQLTAANFTAGTSVININNEDGTFTPVTSTVVIDPRNAGVGQNIDGGSGPDSIEGTKWNDFMRGLDGNDSVNGGAGDDDINGNVGTDTVNGGTGNDWAPGGKDNDQVSGGDGDDAHVNGNIGNDTVHGDAGDDTVYGGQDNDCVYGDSGNDLLSGDLGADNLFGGAGADRFLFGPTGGRDWIMDWNPAEGDRLVLPVGQTYTITSYLDQVMIELPGGAGIGIQDVPESAFSTNYIIFG
jgi:Ca2+-binding RTX toxin-like protein